MLAGQLQRAIQCNDLPCSRQQCCCFLSGIAQSDICQSVGATGDSAGAQRVLLNQFMELGKNFQAWLQAKGVKAGF